MGSLLLAAPAVREKGSGACTTRSCPSPDSDTCTQRTSPSVCNQPLCACHSPKQPQDCGMRDACQQSHLQLPCPAYTGAERHIKSCTVYGQCRNPSSHCRATEAETRACKIALRACWPKRLLLSAVAGAVMLARSTKAPLLSWTKILTTRDPAASGAPTASTDPSADTSACTKTSRNALQ